MEHEISVKNKQSLKDILLHKTAVLQIISGSIFLALMAQIAFPLPFTPVPITLQTLAVALLAIFLGPIKAPAAVMAYLFQATVGLPVLAGGVSNPLWMIGPKAGYLLGFVVASYLTSRLLEKARSHSYPLWKIWISLCANEGTILCMGTLWLAFFLGWDNALKLGFLPFLAGAVLKVTMAAASYRPIEWIKSVVSSR